MNPSSFRVDFTQSMVLCLHGLHIPCIHTVSSLCRTRHPVIGALGWSICLAVCYERYLQVGVPLVMCSMYMALTGPTTFDLTYEGPNQSYA
jgi:hypothetical protein